MDVLAAAAIGGLLAAAITLPGWVAIYRVLRR